MIWITRVLLFPIESRGVDPRTVPPVRRGPLLFDALPDLAGKLPWLPLIDGPSPVEPCEALFPWLGRGGIFMKRDDRISSLYGGNKVRRYEFVLADAKAKGATRIVTCGGIASTQMMATGLFGRKLGFPVTGVLFDQPVTQFARESILGFAEAGIDLVPGGGYVTTAWRTLRAYRSEARGYFIPPGAGNPLANLGYIDAMLELAEQVDRGEAPKPEVIVLPAGSSGTLAAIALGAAWLGWKTEVIGVRITTSLACNRLTIDWRIRATDRFLEDHDHRWRTHNSSPFRRRVHYSLYKDALGKGYGHPTPESIDGIERIRALTGSPGEVTYSGKAIAALHAIANRQEYRDKTILFWNTLASNRPVPSSEAKVPKGFEWVFDGDTVA